MYLPTFPASTTIPHRHDTSPAHHSVSSSVTAVTQQRPTMCKWGGNNCKQANARTKQTETSPVLGFLPPSLSSEISDLESVNISIPSQSPNSHVINSAPTLYTYSTTTYSNLFHLVACSHSHYIQTL